MVSTEPASHLEPILPAELPLPPYFLATATVVRERDRSYTLKLFKNGELFGELNTSSFDRVHRLLKQAGMPDTIFTQCPPIEITFQDPARWFWLEGK